MSGPRLPARLKDLLPNGEGLEEARYLVGGPGWSGAGPAAVGMMSCPCPQMIRGVLSPAAAGRW